MPWLVAVSRHKRLTFSVSGILIGLSFVNMYYVAPCFRAEQCTPENPNACDDASKLSKILLWASAGIYTIGFVVAYVLGPILTRLDN
jgi:mercuric ion transport protein